MKTLKILYYRIKQKGANLCLYYWRKKAVANIEVMKKWNVYFKHAKYWADKIMKYNIIIHQELGS